MITTFKSCSKVRILTGGHFLGRIGDFIFEDDSWEIRFYLIRKTGLFSSRFIIQPSTLGDLARGFSTGGLSVERKPLENAPSLETHRPLNAQFVPGESIYHWPNYPDAGGIWGVAPHLSGIFTNRESDRKNDLHLRTKRDLIGLEIHSRGIPIGRVSDCLIESENSMIRYLVIQDQKFHSGRYLLIAPDWIESLSYQDRHASVNIDLSLFETAPSYQPRLGIDRKTEEVIFAHFRRSPYWTEEKEAAA